MDSHFLDLDEQIHLYRDGRLVDSAKRKAVFALDPSVQIEAAVAKFGMKYVRIRHRDTKEVTQLAPMAGTAEAWRAGMQDAHPRLSRVAAAAATIIAVAALVIELPQLINFVGTFAPHVGLPVFAVPTIDLNWWQNALVVVLGGLAGLERALSMKHNPLLDD